MSDTDERLTVLYGHYKDTFTVDRDRERERDRLSLVLIAALGVLGVQVGYPADAGGVIDTATARHHRHRSAGRRRRADRHVGDRVRHRAALRPTRDHHRTPVRLPATLETHIADELDEPDVFQREGKAYLRDCSAFSDWTWISYVVTFPIVVIVAVARLITVELTQLAYPAAHKLGDTAMAAAIIVSMSLYRLHPPARVVQRLRRVGSRP